MKKMYFFSLSMLLFLLVSISSWATDYYADATRPDDSGDGLSIATAKKTIQAAINAASAGDVVNVAAGTYNEALNITKSLTLQGINSDKSLQIINGTGLGVINGITIANAVTNVTIKNFTIQNFTGLSGNANGGIYGIGGNNNLTVDNVALLNNPTASGFYANGPVSNVSITNSTVSNNGGSARGIVIWNGFKQNITINNNTLSNNSCCGIELQDGTASNVQINGNIIDIGGGDNAIGITGLTNTIGVNTINNNTITGGGRFGIEIKNPAGGVTVSGNSVTLTTQNSDVRDRAGIAVLRRGKLAENIDAPNGVTITGNTVAGYQQTSSSEGFGIVIEGTNHSVTGNTLNNNDVGILQQQNPSGYPGDANQNDVADQYFGRGNSPITCGNTVSGNTFSNNTEDARNLGVGAGLVTNTNTVEYFCSIQPAINDPDTQNGHTITVAAGTYNEQVLVNKGVTIVGVGLTKPIIDFTGTVTGKPTEFDVSADGVTVDNLNFKVDLSKLRSAVIVSAAGIDNITVKNNLIEAYGTPAGSYGDRNAVSINYGGTTNYRVATGGVNNITFQNNTVSGTAPVSYFRSAVSVDEAGGTFTGNTLQTINHDILVRFAGNGAVNITNNNLNGGGVELADQNAAGTFTVSGNTFDATFGNVSAPGTAVLRVKNNYNSIPHIISSNTFTNFDWAMSLENMNAVTFNGNTFTGPNANSRAVVFNTKSISSNSSLIVQVPVALTMTNNIFNGAGTALSFLNHDSDNDAYGTFTIGTVGNENSFAATLTNFIVFDGQTGSTNGSTFPVYPTTGTWPTTMDCWATNMDIPNNKFDVGAGLQLPITMNLAQRTALEGKLDHKPDVACKGLISFYFPVYNVTQNTYYTTIQGGIDAAVAGDVIQVSAGTYNENLFINKALTLTGAGRDLTFVHAATAAPALIVDGNAGSPVLSGNVLIEGFTFADPNRLHSYVVTTDHIASGLLLTFRNNRVTNGNRYGWYDYHSHGDLLCESNIFSDVYYGMLLEGWDTGTLTIQNNEFTNLHYYINPPNTPVPSNGAPVGILSMTYSPDGVDCTNPYRIYENHFHSYAIDGFGIVFNGGLTGIGPARFTDVDIARNTIATGAAGTGIRLRNLPAPNNNANGGVHNASIHNNFISNVQYGIRLQGDNPGTQAHENSLVNCSSLAIENTGAPVMDATCNWFGVTGPAIAALISGNVSYDPSLSSGTDNDVAAGFQPVPGSCTGCSATATISPTTAICSGTGTTIVFTGTPNATVTYTINGGSNTTIVLNGMGSASLPTGNLTATTTYSLVSVNNGICTAPISGDAVITVVDLPNAPANVSTFQCAAVNATTLSYNSAAELTAAAFGSDPCPAGSTIQWVMGVGSTTPLTFPTAPIALGNSGTFYARCQTTIAGCWSTNTTTVSITFRPTPQSALTASKVDVCPNELVTLDAHCTIPTATVNWNPGAPTVTPNAAPTPYIYKASCTAEGCTGNESSVEVRTHRILVDMKDLGSGPLPKAVVGSVQDNMAPTNTITAPTMPRRWTFIANGCAPSESAVFKMTGPVNFNTIDNAATYSMFANEGANFYSIDHPNYGNGGSFPNGTYTLTIDLRGSDGVGGPFPKNRVATGALLATRTLQFTVANSLNRIGTAEEPITADLNEQNWLRIGQNPVSDKIQVHLFGKANEEVHLSLMNLQGQTVRLKSIKMEASQQIEVLDVTDTPSGLYILKGAKADQVKTIKVIKID